MQSKLNTCSLVFLSLIPLLPLFVPWHLHPVASFHYEWVAIMLGLLAWLFALPRLWQQQRLSIPLLALLPLAFMAFIAIQAQILPVVVIQHAQMAMLYLLWAALLMVLVKLLVEQTSRQQVSQWIAMGLTLAAVCSVLIEIGFRLSGIAGWWGGIGQANNYGDLLALGLASVLYLLTSGKSARRVLLWIAAAVIVSGLSLTPSRSVWLYWIAMLVIALLLQRGMVKGLIAGLGLYLLLQVLWTVQPLPMVQTSASSAEKLYQSVGGTSVRLHIWQVAWQLFIKSPWLGQGFGQFDWSYFQAGQHIPELPNRLENAHNLILHLLAELGLFPVLLLVGLLSLWLKNVFAAIAEKRQDDNDSSLTFYVWLLMLLAILGIHSLLEYPLWYAPFLGVTAIILALGETQDWQLRLTGSAKMVVSLLLSVGIGVATIHEWQYNKLENAVTEYSPTGSIQVFAATAQQAPLLAPYVAVALSFKADLRNENSRADLTVLTNASYHFWSTSNLVYRQAALQALNGFSNEAQQTMKLALLAYPNSAKDFIAWVSVLNGKDQKKTAFLRKMAEEKI